MRRREIGKVCKEKRAQSFSSESKKMSRVHPKGKETLEAKEKNIWENIDMCEKIVVLYAEVKT